MPDKHRVISGDLTVHHGSAELVLRVTNPKTHLTNAVRAYFSSDRNFWSVPREGERVSIGDLQGFPEARQTVGIVRKVSHTYTGDSERFTQVITVEMDEVDT